MGFQGKVAIVTGAGSKRGIGRAIALCLAQKGADVVVVDYDYEGASEVAEDIRSLGRRALAIKVDVSSEDQVNEMVGTVLKEFGKIDILVNNAGITQAVKFINMTKSDWDRIMSINLDGVFLCSKAVIKTMIEQNYGRIVNMSSVAGKKGGGQFGGAHYSASKAGVLGFSKALAREVAPYNITVNSICPGTVDTDIRKPATTPEKEKELLEGIPMNRLATTMEIAEGVAFLASDEASYITGEDIDINGGCYMD